MLAAQVHNVSVELSVYLELCNISAVLVAECPGYFTYYCQTLGWYRFMIFLLPLLVHACWVILAFP